MKTLLQIQYGPCLIKNQILNDKNIVSVESIFSMAKPQNKTLNSEDLTEAFIRTWRTLVQRIDLMFFPQVLFLMTNSPFIRKT